MRVTMIWGASGYSGTDQTNPLHLDSLESAKRVLSDIDSGYGDGNGRTPCVEDLQAHIFKGHLEDTTDCYPDFIGYIGRQGNPVVKRCI